MHPTDSSAGYTHLKHKKRRGRLFHTPPVHPFCKPEHINQYRINKYIKQDKTDICILNPKLIVPEPPMFQKKAYYCTSYKSYIRFILISCHNRTNTHMFSSIRNICPLVLNIGIARHECDWNWKNIQSPFTRIYYVTEGTAQIVLPDGTYTLRPNYLYMIPAFTCHSYICQSLFVHYYLHIYEEYQTESGIFDEFDFPVEVEAGDFELSLFQRLLAINPSMQLPASDPTTYDNNPTLVNNIIKYKQSFISRRTESQGSHKFFLPDFLKKRSLNTIRRTHE